MMKKVFAFFCALMLAPNFSAQAWIGGPFSNNSYFSEAGDDGVYEAVAFPDNGAAANGIGIYRFAVANRMTFPASIVDVVYTEDETVNGDVTTTTQYVHYELPRVSNVYLGGFSGANITHTWYIKGVRYQGYCEGVVNSGLSLVVCTGSARSQVFPFNTISSGFQASTNDTHGIPVSSFAGEGEGYTTVNGVDTEFTFFVMGSRVSNSIFYSGVRGNTAGFSGF